MKILILGGTGLIGGNLKKRLSEFYTVHSTSRYEGNADYVFDLSIPSSYSLSFADYDVIINCIVDYNLSLESKIQNDILYKTEFLKFLGNKKAHFIDISSLSALEENKMLSDYNFSKFLSDNVTIYLGEGQKMNYSIVRYAQVFDQQENARKIQKALYYFIDAFRNHTKLNVFGDADFKRSYIPVEIVVETVRLTIEKKIYGQHNVIMPDLYSANNLIEEFNKHIELNSDNICLKPEEAVMMYFIPGCSPAFKNFLSQYNCKPFFFQLLKK